MTEYGWSRYASRGRAGVEKRLGGRIQRISRQRSAARHNVKNGAGYGRECEEDEDAEGNADSGTY